MSKTYKACDVGSRVVSGHCKVVLYHAGIYLTERRSVLEDLFQSVARVWNGTEGERYRIMKFNYFNLFF